MLKLVPKYQKGKVLPTPQQLQQAIDKNIQIMPGLEIMI